MKKLAQLKFDTPNNACLSFKMLAEWARTGDVGITEASTAPHLCEPISAGMVLWLKERDENGRL